MVEAPLQVERLRLVPVALAVRVGEAAVDRAPGVQADKVAAVRCGKHGVDHRFRGRQGLAADVARRCYVGGDQQMRIVSQVRQRLAQTPDRGGKAARSAARLPASERRIVACRASRIRSTSR